MKWNGLLPSLTPFGVNREALGVIQTLVVGPFVAVSCVVCFETGNRPWLELTRQNFVCVCVCACFFSLFLHFIMGIKDLKFSNLPWKGGDNYGLLPHRVVRSKSTRGNSGSCSSCHAKRLCTMDGSDIFTFKI